MRRGADERMMTNIETNCNNKQKVSSLRQRCAALMGIKNKPGIPVVPPLGGLSAL